MNNESQKLITAKVSKKQIIEDLKRIGVKKGDHLAVALSLKKIGFVEEGPNGFIDSLLDVVGSEGTIMMNTFTRNFRASKIPVNYVFNKGLTVPNTGLVPQVFLTRKGVIRSNHPICSVATIGQLSEYLTKDHDEKARDHLPYEKLAKIGGKYLAIGLGNRLVAIRHEAQRRAGYFNLLPAKMGVRYKDKDGNTKLFIRNILPCPRNYHMIVPKIETQSQIIRGNIGNAPSILAPASNLIEALAKILKKEPELTLCDDCFCLFCRNLERKMDLYPKIKNPKLFQRNLLIRRILRLRHNYVLNRDNQISARVTTSKKTKSPHLIKTSKEWAASFIQRILKR